MEEKLGNTIYRLSEIDSTNTYVHQLLEENQIQHGTVVISSNQTKGRGQGENTWESEEGKNMIMSLYLEPHFLPPDKQFYITIFVTLALHDLLSEYADGFQIKWPNDLLHQSHKICGVLIENAISGSLLSASVVGVGLNVNQTSFPKKVKNPTSLALVCGTAVKIEDLLVRFIDKLNFRYQQFSNQKFGLLKSEYLKRAYLLNENHEFISTHGNISGKITDVLDTGELVFQKTGQPEPVLFSFKEIEFPVIES